MQIRMQESFPKGELWKLKIWDDIEAINQEGTPKNLLCLYYQCQKTSESWWKRKASLDGIYLENEIWYQGKLKTSGMSPSQPWSLSPTERNQNFRQYVYLKYFNPTASDFRHYDHWTSQIHLVSFCMITFNIYYRKAKESFSVCSIIF